MTNRIVRFFQQTQFVSMQVIFVATLFMANSLQAQSAYYIDSINGNDVNNGSFNTPFKSVTKLNSMTLTAGTKVYLRSGCSWTGQRLSFKGSGVDGNPILIDKYDTGAAPLLAGNGLVGQAVVYLYNQQYIEIRNLEITNSPRGPIDSDFFVGVFEKGTNPMGADRRGVMVAIDNFGTANHIYLKNLNIHHIKGQLGNGGTTLNGAIPKRTGGIYFDVLGKTEKTSSRSRFNDILIDSCTISYCENIGLAFDNEWNIYYPASNEYNNWFTRRFTNVKISNNILHHIGKNAMIIRCTDSTGLIERNVCYETAVGTTGNTMFTARARGTVFQYNEGYFNRATTQSVDPGSIDGSMYDPDLGSVNVIFQYSYSHDNSQGLYWGCNSRNQPGNTVPRIPDPADTGCTARYNISQNDYGSLVFLNYPSAGNEIYNNIFYSKSSLSPKIIQENGSSNHTYNFRNNIIFNLTKANSSGARYSLVDTGVTTQNRTIEYNTFYGSHPTTEPADAYKLISNPLFVSPGSATIGIYTVDGYKLKPTSPCINSGMVIAGAPSKDFWGNPIPGERGLPTCRGAFEYNTPWPVPITLSSFTGNASNTGNQLYWTTTNEINNKGFSIQHSADGTNFTDIQFIPAQTATGNYVGRLNYTYTDAVLNTGINYYRLKQIDKTGGQTYSSVIKLDNNPAISASVMVYPNPLVGSKLIYLSLKGMPVGVYLVKIISLNGKEIFAQSLKYDGNTSTHPINVKTSLAAGTYLVKVSNRITEASNKLIIR